MLHKLYNSAVVDPLTKRPLLSFSIIAVIFTAWRLQAGFFALLAAVFVVCVLLICMYYKKHIDLFILIFISFAMFFGVFNSSRAIIKREAVIEALVSQKALVTGNVSSVPVDDGENQKFFMDIKMTTIGNDVFDNHYKVYVILSNPPSVKYGDVLVTELKFYNQRYGDFDMSKYIMSKGAPIMARASAVKSVSEPIFPLSIVSKIRNYFIDVSDELDKNKDAQALFRAITIGDKSLFSDNLRDDLSAAGIAHIAAISGLHISFLGFALYRMIKGINRRLAAIISIVAVFIFAAVAGNTPSAMRAAMMYTGYMLGEIFLTRNDKMTSLALSAFILTIPNPYILFDYGYILSFLSVLGIILFSNKIESAFILLKIPRIIRSSASITMSAQILTIPIIMMSFGELSTYAVAVNVIISILFPIALYSCFVTAMVFFVPIVSYAAKSVCFTLLSLICEIAHRVADLPIAHAELENVTAAVFVCYFLIVTALYFCKDISFKGIGAVGILCAVVLVYSYAQSDKTVMKEIGKNSLLVTRGNNITLVLGENPTEIEEFEIENLNTLIVCESGTYNKEDVGNFALNLETEKVFVPNKGDWQTEAENIAENAENVYLYDDTESDLIDLYYKLS